MSKQDRLNSILELVVERGSVEVEEAAQILGVSPQPSVATLMRYLQDNFSIAHMVVHQRQAAPLIYR